MARIRTNTAEGGTSGVAVTAANSGGASGDAFNSVTVGSGATLTYSNAQAKEGSLSFLYGGTATNVNCRVSWSGLSLATAYLREYWYASANPGGTNIFWFPKHGGSNTGFCSITSGGLIALSNSSQVTVATGSVSAELGSWNRVEALFATDGTLEARLYNSPDAPIAGYSDQITGTQTALGANISTIDGPVDWYRNWPHHSDLLAIDNATWAGPEVTDISQAITAAEETNTSVSLLVSDKSKSITSASETNEAVLIAGTGKTQTITPASDSQESVLLAATKSLLVPVATETNSAVNLNPGMISQPITTAEETNTGVNVSAGKAMGITFAQEDDVAVEMAQPSTISESISPATDSNESVEVGRSKSKLIVPVNETNEAVEVAALQDKSLAITPAEDTSVSVSVSANKGKSISPATEINTAIGTTASKIKAIVYAMEVDAAVAILGQEPEYDYFPLIGSWGIIILHQETIDYPLIGSRLFEEL